MTPARSYSAPCRARSRTRGPRSRPVGRPAGAWRRPARSAARTRARAGRAAGRTGAWPARRAARPRRRRPACAAPATRRGASALEQLQRRAGRPVLVRGQLGESRAAPCARSCQSPSQSCSPRKQYGSSSCAASTGVRRRPDRRTPGLGGLRRLSDGDDELSVLQPGGVRLQGLAVATGAGDVLRAHHGPHRRVVPGDPRRPHAGRHCLAAALNGGDTQPGQSPGTVNVECPHSG